MLNRKQDGELEIYPLLFESTINYLFDVCQNEEEIDRIYCTLLMLADISKDRRIQEVTELPHQDLMELVTSQNRRDSLKEQKHILNH